METITAALEYAERGWLVIPLHSAKNGECSCGKKDCGSPGKHPRTKRGKDDGSKEPRQIEQWFHRWPDANLGILTGQASGLVVLDVDGDDGKATLKTLMAGNGPLPKTLCVKTGRKASDGKRKGCHYYFRAPADAVIRNSAGILGKGLDVRGEGGYVVAPPSLHASGLLYEWQDAGMPLAELPAWLAAKLADARPALGTAKEVGEEIPEGGRNDALTRCAGTMRRRGMSQEAIEAALIQENRAHCKPPLPESEVREIARSVARYPPAASAIAATPLPSSAASGLMRQWPAPLAEAAFYGLPGEFVRLVEPQTEADPAALLFQFLAAQGSIIGRGPHMSVGADKHHANLFMVIVGNTAKARKGMSWGEVRRICELTDIEWTRRRILCGLSSGEGLIHAVRDEIKEMVPIKENGRIVRREEQITDPGETDKRLLCEEGELAQALQCAAREGSTLSPVMRLAWDGKALRVLAKNARGSCAEPHISIIGHITSAELLTLLSKSDAANGFANRFIWVCSRRSKHLPFGGTVDPGALARLGDRLRDTVTFARTVGQVAWTPHAARMWEDAYARLSEDKPGLLGQVTARGEAQTLRLAMLYALLDKSAEIRTQHLRAALELWRYCADSAAYIFGQAIGDPTADAIVKLLHTRPDGVTRTDLNAHFDRNKSKAELDRAIALTQENGLIRIEQRETGGRPVHVLRLVSM
jgi:hypothetical protein